MKRIFSLFLALCMIVGLLPAVAIPHAHAEALATAYSMKIDNATYKLTAYDTPVYSVNTTNKGYYTTTTIVDESTGTSETVVDTSKYFDVIGQSKTGANEDNYNAKLIWHTGDNGPTLYLRDFKLDNYSEELGKWRVQSSVDKRAHWFSAILTGATAPLKIVVDGQCEMYAHAGIQYQNDFTIEGVDDDASIYLWSNANGIIPASNGYQYPTQVFGYDLTLDVNMTISIGGWLNYEHSGDIIRVNHGNLTINGGNIITEYRGTKTNALYGISVREATTVTNSNGVEKTVGTMTDSDKTVGNMTVNGGYVYAKSYNSVNLYDAAIRVAGDFTMTGGEVEAVAPHQSGIAASNFYISGGSIKTNTNYAGLLSKLDDGVFSVTGGTIESFCGSNYSAFRVGGSSQTLAAPTVTAPKGQVLTVLAGATKDDAVAKDPATYNYNNAYIKLEFVDCEHPNATTTEEIVADATCTVAGSKTITVACEECGQVITETVVIEANGHTEEIIPGTVTCTEAGLSDGVKCSVCGEVLVEQTEVPATHKAVEVERVEPTTTTVGTTAGTKCSVCGEILSGCEEIPMLKTASVKIMNSTTLSVTEGGEAKYAKSVSGTAYNAAGEEIGLYWKSGSGTADDWNVKFEYPMGGVPTLTLKDATFDYYDDDGNLMYTKADGTGILNSAHSGIFPNSVMSDLKIILQGTNHIDVGYGIIRHNYGGNILGNITVVGEAGGSLSGRTRGAAAFNLTAGYDLVLENANLDVWTTAGGGGCVPLAAQGGNVTINGGKLKVSNTQNYAIQAKNGNLTITNAEIEASSTFTSSTNGSGSIHADGILTITNSTITSSSTNGLAISGNAGIVINGGTYNLTGYNYAVNNTITINGGEIEAIANNKYAFAVAPDLSGYEGWNALAGANKDSVRKITSAEALVGLRYVKISAEALCDHTNVTTEEKVLVDATCTTAGSKQVIVTCECGETISETTEEIAAKGHTEVEIPAVECTCTATGLTAGKKCSVCGTITVEQEVVAAKGHTEEIIPGKAATCTETGLTEGVKCSVCDDILTAQTEIAAKGHTEEIIPGKDATCTETGLTESVKCTVCGTITVEQEVVAAKGHTEEIIPGKDATCTETGLTEGKKCSVCGEILVAQEIVAAKGHTEEIIPGKDATCTETGLTEGKKCSVCGETIVAQEEIAALGHTEGAVVKENEVEADYNTEGSYDSVVYCSVCNAELSRVTVTIPVKEGAAAEIDGYKYATLQEAIDAAGNGATVKLLTDLNVESELNNAAKGLFNIAADDNIIIDLNGKTINVTDNSQGNFIVFYNYGELTIKNGTVNLTATNNREWNAQSTIILNRGGVLVMESGTYKHLGGTDMAIAVDNSANSFGDAYMTIKGGNIETTYTAIRMRMADPALNGNPGNGVCYLTVEGGYIYGASRGIWGQITNASAERLGALDITGGTVAGGNNSIRMTADGNENIDVAISGEANIVGALSGEGADFAITGGTFDQAVPEDLCSDGFIPTANGDGTYGVKVGEYVAQIGDAKYETLQEAVNVGGEVKLLTNVELDAPIVIEKGKEVTLNLGTYKISYTSTVMGEAMITNRGTLTINGEDGSEIYYNYVGASDSSYGKGNYTISNGGTLTVNGGKIHIANLRAHAKYPIDNNSTSGDAVLVINGGHLYNYNTSAIRQFCNSTTNKNSVTINGGLIEGYCAIWVQNPSKTATANAQLTINGGEIKTTAAAYVNGTAELKDVSSHIYATTEGGAWSEDSVMSFNGGIFNENVDVEEEAPAIVVSEEAVFNGRPPHTHNFVATYTEPTFEADGFWTYACSCGEIEKTVIDEGSMKIAVAQVGDKKFETVMAAVAYAIENDLAEVKVLSSVRELLPTDIEWILNTDLTITADEEVEVVFYNNGTTYDLVIDSVQYKNSTLTIGENVTIAVEDRIIWVGYYFRDVKVDVYGTMEAYQIWMSETVNVYGELNVTGEAFVLSYDCHLNVEGGTINANYFQINGAQIVANNAIINSGKLNISASQAYVSIILDEGTVWTSTGNLNMTNSANPVYVYLYDGELYTTTFEGYELSKITANSGVYLWGGNWTNKGNLNVAGTLEISEGSILTTDVYGTVIMDGGDLVTPQGYKMLGANAEYYNTSDATITMAGGTGDITVHSGTLTLVPDLWYTGVGQTLTIAESATFVIPAGKTLYINGSNVVADGIVANYGTLLLADGAHVKGDIAGTFKMAGGTYETSKYVMIGATEGKYLSSDAVFTVMPNETMDMTVVSGTITLNDADWWTLVGQTLTIAKDAKFIVPAGKNINVQGTVIVDGTAVVDGTVTLYNKTATIKAAEGLNVITNAGDKVWYTEGTYVVHDHTEEIIPGKAATCTETGLTEGKKCSVCGEILVAQEEIAALGHTEEIIPGKDATCTETGLTEGKKCTVCGTITVEQTVIDALGHTEEIIPGKAATCTETGLTEGKKCTVCGTITVEQTVIDALGHTEVTTVDTIDATCTTAGSKKTTVTCSVCDAVISETTEKIPALGHTEVTNVVTTDATCATVGSKKTTVTCEICGEIISVTTEVIPAKGHTEVTTVTGPDATCTETGIKKTTVTCEICGEIISVTTVEVPATGHIYDNDYDTECNSCGVTRVVQEGLSVTEDNKLQLVDGDDTHIYHRVTIYFLGNQTVTDITDEEALKAIDPDAVTVWDEEQIDGTALTESGNYVLVWSYNDTKLNGKKVTIVKEASVVIAEVKLPTVEIVDENRISVTAGDANCNHYRAVVYYLGNRTVADITKEAALKALDSSAETVWGLDAINNIQLWDRGNYVIHLYYNIGTGAKQLIAKAFTIEFSELTLDVIGDKVVAADPNNAYIYHRAVVYNVGDELVDISNLDEILAAAGDNYSKTYWTLDAINTIRLTESGNYVVVMYYNLPNSPKMFSAVAAYI